MTTTACAAKKSHSLKCRAKQRAADLEKIEKENSPNGFDLPSPSLHRFVGRFPGRNHDKISANKAEILTDYRLREYLETIDIAESALTYMDKIGRATSGRVEPDENSTDEEIEEAERRDNEGAAAVEGLLSCLPALRRQTHRVSIFGSKRVSSSSKRLILEIESYFEAVKKELLQDGIFRAKTFNSARGDFELAVNDLIDAIGHELK